MLTLSAPAKINWFLLVTGRRPDGYHEIVSLMQPLDLSDTLTFEHSSSLDLLTDAPIPTETNLAYKAAVLLRNHTGTTDGARITLAKRIPLAAGLGGGSSDAAAALLGLNRLWGLGLAIDDLMPLAASLGSDVPFFLLGRPAIVRGRGEVMEAVDIGRSRTVLLLKPSLGVAAAEAYGGIRQYSASDALDIPGFLDRLGSDDISGLAPRNDLEPPVFSWHPQIREMKEALVREGASLSLMSGSGSTVFGVFPGPEEASRAAARIDAPFRAVTRTIC
jgi:4-diphosphocytidyl-2-C-methyl-D-erythritol kinase